jgi:hypothetical protein
MAKETKKGAKSEILSMRMDQRTRFLVEFIARFKGQSITTVVERAIQEAADNVALSNAEFDDGWKAYWHVNEGIRSLKVWSEKRLFPTFDEEEIVSFTKIHWPFFYANEQCNSYKEWSIDVVWPRINEFVETWKTTKSTNYWASGKAMQEAIAGAGLKAPEWPPKQVQAIPVPKGRLSDQLDDDIPF